ncbi:MAG: glycosyltransferase family 2 protein [Lachnospiraceae bacterium]|nr:glycosyltransferase family 2 protein [Lachnospiraceae bacterium]
MKVWNPLISVIIPVYNMEKYLQVCVESVRNQTYRNLEILLVDDGSRDSSPTLCDAYAREDGRIRVIHKENGGLMSAWMTGVREAEGEFFCFVDSDDWIDREMIGTLAEELSGECEEIVCCNYRIEKKDRSIPVRQSMEPGSYDREETERLIFPRLLGKEIRSIHCSRCMKLFSRKLILKNLSYCNTAIVMGEDLNIVFPALLDAQRIVVMEDSFYYHYRFVDSSMVHKYDSRMYENIRLLQHAMLDIVKGKSGELPGHVNWEEAVCKEVVFLLFYVLKNELRGSAESYRERTEQICKEAEGLPEVVVEQKANRLLYWILRHPGRLQIALGRLAITVFDRMGKLG